MTGMQSCPRCGTHVGAETICPACGLPLFSSQRPVANPMPQGTPLARAAGEPSPNGNSPQTPPVQGAASNAAQPSGERWGTPFWGSGVPPVNEPPPGPPMTLREYGSGVVPRPYPPYRPPAGPGAPGYPDPGYPLIPQTGQAPAYPGYLPYPGMGGYPPGWYPYAPPRVPGETYRKALGIITIIATSLLLLGGLALFGITALLLLAGDGEDLSVMSLLVMLTLASLAGGGGGLYHSIRALMRRPSAPFSLPSFWVLLALTVLILGTGIALLATNQPTGSVELIILLVLLSSIVPYLAVLALGLQRMGTTITWRHVVLAWTNGATLAVVAASLLELVLALALLGITSVNLDLTNFNPNDSFGTVAVLILVAVIAPLVEETTKQISGFFLLPRMKGPQEAFLIGLASGIGFAMVETAGYIGSAQADWIGIALGRVGAGLLHGMGAAMAGVGWYYVVKGKGAPRRGAIAAGCLVYAYVQHAIFNGGQVLLVMLFPDVAAWHVDLFDVRLDITIVYAGILYVVILVIMLLVIRWLRRSAPAGASAAAGTAAGVQPAPNVSLAAYSDKQMAANLGGPIASAAPTNTLNVGEPGTREPGGTG